MWVLGIEPVSSVRAASALHVVLFGLELPILIVSASQMLGLRVFTTTPSFMALDLRHVS